MRQIIKRESLGSYHARKQNAGNRCSARKEKRKSYFDMNLSFLKEYNEENNLEIADSKLREMAYRFTSWEKVYVNSFKNGYEDYRDQVFWLDYDEILEMYIENEVHPFVKASWQSEENFSFFIDTILPQMNAF